MTTTEPVTAATCKIRAAHRPHEQCPGTAPEFPWERVVLTDAERIARIRALAPDAMLRLLFWLDGYDPEAVDAALAFAARQAAAVQRVVARGSTPGAAAEAEGDFGPGGTFA